MEQFRRIGLILIVVFGVLYSLSSVNSYIAGELGMRSLLLHLGGMAVVFILFLYLYKARMVRTIERSFLEIRGINGWHVAILSLLTLWVAPMSYVIFSRLAEITIAMWISYGLSVSLFLFFIHHLIADKIKIDANGLWTSSFQGYFSWDHFERAKLKWNGKLLILGNADTFILPKPHELIEALEEYRPNLAEKMKDQIER